MTDFDKQCLHELSREYVFKTFDFANCSPEELLEKYREVHKKLADIVDNEVSEFAAQTIKSFGF